MPEVKFTRVISCSSEDKDYPAKNLLRSEAGKSWKSKAGDKEAIIIMEMEKPIHLQSLQIGNDGSAFLEILGSNSSSPDDYKLLLPKIGFMTPEESRTETNLHGTRSYSGEKLAKVIRDFKLDRLKIICSQPFNKELAFGLRFIRIQERSTAIGNFRLKDDVDESGLSRQASIDLAPGALFSTRKTATIYESQAANSAVESEESEKPRNSGRKKTESKANTSVAKRHSTENATAKASPSKAASKSITSKEEPSASKSPSSNNDSSASKSTTHKNQASIKRSPFDKLFHGVIFVLSGFQNPLRSELRDKALEMGAQYRPDWATGCTHLICAFANTPKYDQVNGKGRIVKKGWIMDSHKRRRKLNWKKYAFETNDKFPDEEEVVADDAIPAMEQSKVASNDKSAKESKSDAKRKDEGGTSSVTKKPKQSTLDDDNDPYNQPTDYSDSGDTDDEIRRVKKRKTDPPSTSTATEPKPKSPTKPRANISTIDLDLQQLPDFFSGMHFFLYGGFPEQERKQLRRYIVAFNGILENYMAEKVTHVLTRENWDDSFDEALNDFPKLIFLKPDFVLQCGKQEKLVDIEQYKVKKR